VLAARPDPGIGARHVVGHVHSHDIDAVSGRELLAERCEKRLARRRDRQRPDLGEIDDDVVSLGWEMHRDAQRRL
jgi:hypothetical protein